MCFHFLKCKVEKQMRLKVMRHGFFFFFFLPSIKHYIIKIINSFRNKDTCHYGWKKATSKVTIMLVRLHCYRYCYVEQHIFFAPFYIIYEVLFFFFLVFFILFFSSFPFIIFDLFAPPFRKPWIVA